MTSLKDYEILNKIGSGSYGIVHKVRSKHDKHTYVLKQVDVSKLSPIQRKQAQSQANILRQLCSPYIVKYFHSFLEKGTLNIIMEFCSGGDLDRYIKGMMGRPMKEEQIWKFFIQMCIGLRDIHQKRVLHRDIKAQNVFLTQEENIRIGDLGVARKLEQGLAHTIVGTPYYLSPEMCEEKPYNEKTDIWAMGCVLYQMCTGRYPFEAKTQASLALKIVTGKYQPIPTHYSQDIVELVNQCLSVDHRRRPTANYILEKPKIREIIKNKGIDMDVEREFEKGKVAVVGVAVRKVTPPKGEMVVAEKKEEEVRFKQAEEGEKDEKEESLLIVEQPTLQVGKWQKNKPTQKDIKPPTPKPQPRLQIKPQLPKPKPPTPAPGRKTPVPDIRHPIKDPKQQRRIRQQQRKKELQQKKEKDEQRIREFREKKEEERKEKLRKEEQKRKEQEARLREIKKGKEEKSKEKNQEDEAEKVVKIPEFPKTPKPGQKVLPRPASEKQLPKPSPKTNKKPEQIQPHGIPDQPDSDQQLKKQKQKAKTSKLVQYVQKKVDDDQLQRQFGFVSVQPAKVQQCGNSFQLKNPTDLHWQQPHIQVTKPPTTASLPTFTSQQLPTNTPIIVEQYDPNQIMQQLQQNQPDISSIDTDDQQQPDNPYLIEQGHNKQQLQKMLEQNEGRANVIQRLIDEKQTDLFKHITKEECERLKTMIREEEELGEGLMKAFKDQKVLYNFYKVIQLDSQLGECYRTIGHIKEKLRNMSAVKEVVRFE